VARADRTPLTAAEEAELEAWLATDARHAGAYARARAVALWSERAAGLGSGYRPRDFTAADRRRPLSRRQLLMVGASLAAGIGGAGFFALAAQGQTYVTRLGEMKVAPLADGSVISLNTDTRVQVRYSRHAREVRLDRGEALFDVATDASRPFRVRAGDAEMSAVGASFSVRRIDNAPVQVLVREGLVDVRDKGASAQVVRAAAHMRIVAEPLAGSAHMLETLAATPVSQGELDRALAWRDGRIVFQDETLARASAEFTRYSDTRIVIDDPAVGSLEITGLFQTNDPVGFAKATADSLGLRVAIGDKQVRLYR
jgi:transmembrane sensor